MQEIRCPSCNKLLFKGNFDTVEIKCPRCGKIVLPKNPNKKEGRKNEQKENKADLSKTQITEHRRQIQYA